MSNRIDTITDEQTRAFAVACYDTNSLRELQAPHAPSDADATDCETWGITPDQWSEAIEAALADRLVDGLDATPYSGPQPYHMSPVVMDRRLLP